MFTDKDVPKFTDKDVQKIGEAMVKWLNSPTLERTLYREAVARAKACTAGFFDGLGELTKLAEVDRKQSIAERLNLVLAECPFIPQIDIEVWRPRMNIWGEARRKRVEFFFNIRPVMETEIKGSSKEWHQWDAIQRELVLLLDLWRMQGVEKIRRCKQCGRFFYMLRSDHQSCSARCREDFYKQTSEARAKRNKRLRENYRLKKSANIG